MDQNVGEDPHPHNPLKGKACIHGGLEAKTGYYSVTAVKLLLSVG